MQKVRFISVIPLVALVFVPHLVHSSAPKKHAGGVSTAKKRSRAPSRVSTPIARNGSVKWPGLWHRAGTFWIKTPADVAAARAAGMNLTALLPRYVTPGMRVALTAAGMKYVDFTPYQIIQTVCNADVARAGICSITPQQEASIEGQVRRHLAAYHADPLVAAYIILDDYPGGDIRPTLEAVHRLIEQDNQTSVFPRAALLDFGGWLDYMTPYTRGFTSNDHSFNQALVNYSPGLGDAILLYPEGYNAPKYWNDPQYIDWSMSKSLPYMLKQLRARGWNQVKQPIIGDPQTYTWTEAWWRTNDANGAWKILPRAQDVMAMTRAFVRVGAIALLSYAWDDPYHDASVKDELSNTRSLLSGYKDGINQAMERWHNH